ncbi:methionyl-tRNA formyltransferase [Vibrio mimicus]|uniref:methionyl-tRNA formyltransferase n=1 Tax=Vibrio mimicus TaxID=674 RepID=UPI0011DB811B|nr:methionyl-tRNA formyltransferase [Vibrio mimicus]TXZ77086.1 methionyl-tRNA formyltransferase [Vibrio mimicus]BCN22677.1 putative formyltransferase [Vibrio mimicus]
MNHNNYLVATIKPWNIEQFYRVKDTLPGNWHLVTDHSELTIELLELLNPRYIFFPHWSWIVPREILKRWECVCFHMADVPYGRGGSPLQNLIVRGHKETKLSALRMIHELDAGPVYKKMPLSLDGTAQDIFYRMAPLILDLAREIVINEPEPQEQKGEVTVFKRRTPEQSILPGEGQISNLYDHIRMLDAETYPIAFLLHGEFRLEFSQAEVDVNGRLNARVSIVKNELSK